MCRRRRDDDDDEGSPPWPPPRGEDPSQPATPLPASPNAQQATMRDQAASLRKSAKKARRQPARNKRAKPSRGQNVKHAKEPKQHAADSIPSEPTTPTRGGPVCCQEDSNLVAQTLSPATVQGNDLAQPFCADSNRHANLDYPPAQPNGTQFQPHVPAHDPAQSVLNNDHAQDLMTQHGVDSAHLTTLNQSRFRMPLEQTGHNYPGSQEAFSTHDSAGVQASAYPAVPTQPGCLCGQSCNCEWCPSHPLNPATQECVNEMTRVLASDHYLDEFPHPSQPEFGTGGTLSNGISTESAVEQGYPPLANDEALDLDPSAWNNMPDQGAPLQPPINQGESVSNNNLSDDFYFATVPNPGYLTVEYPLNRNYSDAPGTCLRNRNCVCEKCLTYQGYNGVLI